MPKKDRDQPPADLPLAEAFVRLMRPSAELIEVARQKALSRNNSDWRTCLLERAVTAKADIECGRTPPIGGEEAAVLLDRFRLVMANDARATGRAGSLLGPKQDLSPELWLHIEIRGDGTIEVPGVPPIRLYDVVVRLGKPSKRGAPPKKVEALCVEMHAMIQTEGLKRHTAAMRLVAADRVPGQTTTDESKAKRLVIHYNEWLSENSKD